MICLSIKPEHFQMKDKILILIPFSFIDYKQHIEALTYSHGSHMQVIGCEYSLHQ